MKKDALNVVQEFLVSDDPQIRSNAVVALSTIGNEESGRHILNVATKDGDADVRQLAEDEFLRLGGSTTGVVQQFVDSMEASNTGAVYALLGRLRHRGYQGKIVLGNMAKHLRLGFGIFSSLTAAKKKVLYKRSLWPALSGAIVGVIFCNVAIGWKALDDFSLGEIILVLAMLVGASLVISVLSAQRASPISLYYDRLAGGIIELAWAALWGLLVGLPVAILTGLNEVWSGGYLLLMSVPLTLIVSVRAGSMLAAGIPSKFGHWLPIVSAAASGALILTVTSLAGSYLGDMQSSYYNAMWYALLPSTVALAYVYAAVDREPSGEPEPIAGRQAGLIAWTPIALLALGYAMAVVNPLPTSHLLDAMPKENIHNLQIPCDKPHIENQWVRTFPVRYDFEVDGPCRIAVNVQDDREDSWVGVTNLVFDKKRQELGQQNTPNDLKPIEFSSSGGEYSIILADTWQIEDFFDEITLVNISNLLSSLANRFRETIGMPEDRGLRTFFVSELSGDVMQLSVQLVPVVDNR